MFTLHNSLLHMLCLLLAVCYVIVFCIVDHVCKVVWITTFIYRGELIIMYLTLYVTSSETSRAFGIW